MMMGGSLELRFGGIGRELHWAEMVELGGIAAFGVGWVLLYERGVRGTMAAEDSLG